MPKTIVYCYNHKCLHNPAGLCIRGFVQLNCMGMCDNFIIKAGEEAGHPLTSQSSGGDDAEAECAGCTLIISPDCLKHKGLVSGR